jgi:hypothetical protein
LKLGSPKVGGELADGSSVVADKDRDSMPFQKGMNRYDRLDRQSYIEKIDGQRSLRHSPAQSSEFVQPLLKQFEG